MYRTLIIEDEGLIRKEISWMLAQEPDMVLAGTASGVSEGIALIEAVRPDLVLIDIELTDGTAFDLLQHFDDIGFHIVFITAYNNFAIRAIKYGAIDYLLKPLVEDELKNALQRVRARRSVAGQKEQLSIVNQSVKDQNSRLALHSTDHIQLINIRDIIYCHGEGPYTHFFLTDDKRFTVSKPLKFYEELLPEGAFLRTHQSYIVNVSFIDRYLKNGILVLRNKSEVPVSTRRKEHVLKLLSNPK